MHVIADTYYGAIAQLGERLICIQEVCGSIPHSSTILDVYHKTKNLCGRLAQLGEHLPYKQGVTGSSPVSPTIFKRT